MTEGFKKEMDIVGVGYKADVQGKKIVFALGYSHPIEYPLARRYRCQDRACRYKDVDQSVSD